VDLLVTDYAMPGMTGSVLAARLREQRPDLPILMVTGHVDDSLRIESGAWTASTFLLLRKPVTTGALEEAFGQLMGLGSEDHARLAQA
jgi:FixJ family two-component response regulator